MLETVNLALGILVFGGAASLVGLWLLVMLRRPGAMNALRLAAALALFGAACLDLASAAETAWPQSLAEILLIAVIFADGSLLYVGERALAGARRPSGAPQAAAVGFPADAIPAAASLALLGVYFARSKSKPTPASIALVLFVLGDLARFAGGGSIFEAPDIGVSWHFISRAAFAVGLFLLGSATLAALRGGLRLRSELNVFFLMGLLASAAAAGSTGLLSREVGLNYPPDRLCYFVLLPLLALGLALAPLAAARLNSSLEELSRRTRPLTQGNLDNFVNIESGDEIQEVSESIRVMVHAVQRNRADLEEQLARLQELDKLRQQFMANVSHELRTPLTMILGNTDILLEEILGKLNEEQKDFLRTVHEQGQVLHQLIGDVLAFADIKAGRSELNVKEVDVRQLVLAILERFTPLLRHKSLKVQGKIPEIKIVADAEKLRQVLTHLVSNAVKFSKKGGNLRVGVIPAPEAAKGSYVRFEVVDNGLGIPKGHLARIFDTFYQVDGSSTREHGGTGIGLTIVKHYVEMHGGRVDIQSEVGKGTAVRFDLPVRPLPSTVRSASDRSGDLPDNPRVLLTSQNLNLVRILKTYLVQGGFDVFSVSEIDKVESEAERLSPGLVVLDADSDDEAFWHVVARLQESRIQKHRSILSVSTRLSRSTAASRGAVEFLELPTDYETFIRVVKSVAASAR